MNRPEWGWGRTLNGPETCVAAAGADGEVETESGGEPLDPCWLAEGESGRA